MRLSPIVILKGKLNFEQTLLRLLKEGISRHREGARGFGGGGGTLEETLLKRRHSWGGTLEETLLKKETLISRRHSLKGTFEETLLDTQALLRRHS